MASAAKNEIHRKLEYIKKLVVEAVALLEDIPEMGNQQMIDIIETQTELMNTLLQQLATGKMKADQMDDKFLNVTRRMLQLKRAELAVDMDEAEADYVAKIRNKDYKG